MKGDRKRGCCHTVNVSSAMNTGWDANIFFSLHLLTFFCVSFNCGWRQNKEYVHCWCSHPMVGDLHKSTAG